MTRVVEAVYTEGVLKPLEPLDLSDQQRVELTLRVLLSEPGPADRAPVDSWPEMEATSEARQAALDELFDEIDRANVQLRLRLPLATSCMNAIDTNGAWSLGFPVRVNTIRL